jgi:N-acetylmuramoyl-L-alanine amidase
MVRIHADGSQNTSLHGISTLVPAWHRGWTNDIYGPSLRAGRMLQRALVSATGAADRGLVRRSDLTGFNWANVPAVLVEAGFLSNPAERRLLHSGAYQQRLAVGLTAGIASFIALPSSK